MVRAVVRILMIVSRCMMTLSYHRRLFGDQQPSVLGCRTRYNPQHNPRTHHRPEAAVTEPLWRGVAVALVTLFDEGGAVDVPATAAHAARLVELGVRAVLVGASAAWAGAAAERVTAAVTAGADAVLVAPPRRAGDLAGFYRTIAGAAGGAPVLAYHFPGVVGGAVPVEALPELAISGIKDSTGDPERLLRTLDAWTGWTYVGSSTVVSYAGQLGASGAILAVANAVPEECLAAFDGDGAAQRRLIVAHLAARDRFPRGLKELVAQRFGTPTASRLG